MADSPRIDWYRTRLEPGVLRSLTQRSDFRGLLQAGGLLLLFSATAATAVYFFLNRMWVPMVVACYVHSMVHGFVGMEAAVHELSHGTPFKTKWLNEFFYRLFSFLTWNNYVHFRASHMKHHQYTVHRGLDKEVILEPAPFSWVDYLSWLTFDFKKFKMIFVTTVANAFGNAEADTFFWDPLFKKGDPRRRELVNWARFVVVGHVLLVGVFIYFELWVMIYLITFGYFFATFPSRACGMQQHIGLSPNVPDWRLSCHTMLFGPLPSFLYWRMNYHIEHHMFAAVPFFNLPKLHDAVAFDTPEPTRGYFRGIFKVIGIQKRQREEPSYVYVPALPDGATPAQSTPV